MTTKFVCISDTHERLSGIDIPEGDVLIHAGDLTFKGEPEALIKEFDLLQSKTKNFKHVVVVQGNHEYRLRHQPELVKAMAKERNIILLHHELIELEGFKIFGSPYTPIYGRWAFMAEPKELNRLWGQIPDETDILITHGQPYLINDIVPAGVGSNQSEEDIHVGCHELADRITQLKNLKLYVGGHLHSGYGNIKVFQTTFVNAAILNEKYEIANKPIIVEI